MKSDIIPKEPKTRANTGKTKRICRFRDVAFLLKDLLMSPPYNTMIV